MAARVCPYCRELNSVTEKRCYRCGRRLPGPFVLGVLKVYRDVLGVDAPMTRLIVGIELVLFVLAVIVNGGMPPITGFIPGERRFSVSTLITFGSLGGGLGVVEPFRMLSAVFVHMSLLHVGMNMLTHVSFARPLEQLLGPARLCVIFVVSGLLGFVASEAWYGGSGPLTAGASGGVFGEIGAIVGVLYARRDPTWKKALARNIVLALILGILLPVNTPAHLGGFFAGIVIAFALSKEVTKWRLHRAMAVFAGFLLVASVGSVALSAVSPYAVELREQQRRGE